MSKLYKDARPAVLDDAARAYAHARGVKDPEKIAGLQTHLRGALTQFIATRPNLSAKDVRDLGTTVLAQAERVATGQVDGTALDRVGALTRAQLKSQHGSNRNVDALLQRTNAHLKTHEPQLHAALNPEKSPAFAGIGNNPQIVLRLAAEQTARDHAAEKAPFRDTYLKRIVHAHAAAAVKVPPGGFLAGK